MAGKSKKLKKLEDHHDYLNRKTKELDKVRGDGDRDYREQTIAFKIKEN